MFFFIRNNKGHNTKYRTLLKTIGLLTMTMFLLTVFIANGETGSIGEPEVLHVM